MSYMIAVKLGSVDLSVDDEAIELERVEYVESIDDLDALTAEFSTASTDVGGTWGKVKPGTVYTVQFKVAKTGSAVGAAIKGTVVDVQLERMSTDRYRFTVVGLEDLCKLRGSAAEIAWEDAPDKIVKAIAQAGGLTADADASDVVKYRVDRGGMDDVVFLKSMAARFHYRVGIEAGKLVFKRRTVVSSTVPIPVLDVQASRLRASVHGLATDVTVWGRDPKQNGWFSQKVSSVPRGISGTDMGTALAKKVYKNAAIEVRDAGCPSPGAAKERATAEYRLRAERYIEGTLELDGNPKVRTGTDIDLKEGTWPFLGKYRVRQARHVDDRENGYRTWVDFYSDSLPAKV